MLNRFKDLSIIKKNLISFGAILCMLLLLVAFSILSFAKIEANLFEYSEYNSDYATASKMAESLLLMRLKMKDFLLSNETEDLTDYYGYKDEFENVLTRAKSVISDPERVKYLNEIDALFMRYNETFSQVSEIIKSRNESVTFRYGPTAKSLRTKLSAIIESAYNDGDPEAAFLGDQAIQALLLGRVYFTRFVSSSSESDIERARKEFTVNFSAALEKLDSSLQNPQRRALLQEAYSEKETLLDTTRQIEDYISRRNELVIGQLDVIGPQIAEKTLSILTSVDEDRLVVQAEVKDNLASVSLLIIVLAIIAFFICIASIWLVNHFIVKPIAKVSSLAVRIADGDLTGRVEISGEDEVGQLAQSLNRTSNKLNGDISSISDTSNTLSSNVTHLTNVSDNTLSNMEKNMQTSEMVATATEEMASTIREIASLTEKANTASTDAASTVFSGRNTLESNIQAINALDEQLTLTSKDLAQVEQNMGDIEGIVEVINGISEQTNLLALNAAIEAARAGEHGRGFAVVADEVRSLAAKTRGSTGEISKLIERLQSVTDSTVSQMNSSCENARQCVEQSVNVQAAFDDIATAIDQLKDLNTQVATATEENATVAQQVAASITEVRDGSAVTIQEANKTVEISREVDVSARDLSNLVRHFKIAN